MSPAYNTLMKETYPSAQWGLYRVTTFYMPNLRIICFSDYITSCSWYKQYCHDSRDLNLNQITSNRWCSSRKVCIAPCENVAVNMTCLLTAFAHLIRCVRVSFTLHVRLPNTRTTRLIYSVAVVRKDSEVCSEVKHKRFETGSDTVIHSAQIKSHLSLELTVLSAKNYKSTSDTMTLSEPTTINQYFAAFLI